MRRVIRALGPENEVIVMVVAVSGDGVVDFHTTHSRVVLTDDVLERVRQALADARAERLQGVRWEMP